VPLQTNVAKKRLQHIKYQKQKLKKIQAAVNKRMLQAIPSSTRNRDDESEIMRKLKDKSQETIVRSEKVQVLTALPKSWSIRRIEEEFGASNYMV